MTALSQEWKIVGSSPLADFALAWLEHACRHDPKFYVGLVNSIYFDTPALASFHEKGNGDFLKTKVRLRWYRESQSAAPVAFLEIKERVGSARRKARRLMAVDPDWINSVRLESGEVEAFLREESGEFSGLFERNLVPVTTIVYRRHRFVCPATGARVALDTAIHSDRINTRHVASTVPGRIDAIVLELKGVRTPHVPWLDELYRRGFRARSFSKYYECMVQSLHGGMKSE